MNRREFNLSMISAGIAATLPFSTAYADTTATARSEAAAPIRAIDTHAHVFHRGLPFVPNRRYTPEYDAFPQDYLQMLDSNNMSHGVIIPISILGTNNDYTIEVLHQNPQRLRGLAVIDPQEDIEKLEAFNNEGIVGIRLNLIGKPVPEFNNSTWQALISECKRLNWQIEVYDNAQRLPETLTPLVDAGVNVVVDHFGKPDPSLGINDPGFQYLCGLANTRQVWVKLSAPYRSSNEIAQAAAPLLRQAFGPERLMWGSDWPHTGFEGKVEYATLRGQLDIWVPDADERQIVLADTPAQLFSFN